MLAVNKYPQEYVDECRKRMDAQLAAYKAIVTAADKAKATSVGSAVEKFEPLFFNNLTLVLDHDFMHRTRTLEGKDGNPINEVRMLCTSIMSNQGVLAADKTIKYKPETSVLNLAIGDDIRIDEKQFRGLFKAFFAEIEAKFT